MSVSVIVLLREAGVESVRVCVSVCEDVCERLIVDRYVYVCVFVGE